MEQLMLRPSLSHPLSKLVPVSSICTEWLRSSGSAYRIRDMINQLIIGTVLLLVTFVPSIQAESRPDRSTAGSSTPVETNHKSSQVVQKQNVPIQPSASMLPREGDSSLSFRDIPSISGRYSVGGKTIAPYVGAGFGGGYTSEFNRTLANPSPMQTDQVFRSQFGQVSSPNEFQMGLRIPF